LKSHWETLYACDFFTVETLGVSGTVRQMVFFVIEIKTRAIHIAGICVDPDADWAKQAARNLVDPLDGFLRNAKHLVHDRDPLFNKAWSQLLGNAGVSCVAIPAQSPNCNPYAERALSSGHGRQTCHAELARRERQRRYRTDQNSFETWPRFELLSS